MESDIASVVLFHLTDDNGNSIPLRIEVNSWVTLQPGERGGHARDARKHGGASLSGAYKAKIIKFKASRSATSVSQILVQHAYMPRQLHLNPHTPIQLESACNCKLMFIFDYFYWFYVQIKHYFQLSFSNSQI